MLGRNWSSNGDFLTPAFYPSRRPSPSPAEGPPITAVIDYLDRSHAGESFWIQDGGFPDLLAQYVEKLSTAHPRRAIRPWLMLGAIQMALAAGRGQNGTGGNGKRGSRPVTRVMPWFAQAVDAGDGVLRLKRSAWPFGRRRLDLKWNIGRSKPAIDAVVAMHQQLSDMTGGVPLVPPGWSLLRDLITPHPLGGCAMADSPTAGVVNDRGEVFGQRNLFVADGAIFPRAIGVNPSRTIAALAERIAAKIIESNR
jgi:cholesterol oxidase